jgi:hypothetical protein
MANSFDQQTAYWVESGKHVDEAVSLAAQIAEALPDVKRGSLDVDGLVAMLYVHKTGDYRSTIEYLGVHPYIKSVITGVTADIWMLVCEESTIEPLPHLVEVAEAFFKAKDVFETEEMKRFAKEDKDNISGKTKPHE